jgi:hypothetical protein
MPSDSRSPRAAPDTEPIVCPRCKVKNWDRIAAEAHARWCAAPAPSPCPHGCAPLHADPDSDARRGCRCEGACLTCHPAPESFEAKRARLRAELRAMDDEAWARAKKRNDEWANGGALPYSREDGKERNP